jgi:hypothetical protein
VSALFGGRAAGAFLLADVDAGRQPASEAYQRAFHLVKQTGPGALPRVLSGDEYIVRPRVAQSRQAGRSRFAKPPSRPVSDDGISDFPGRRKARPNVVPRLGPASRLHDERSASFRKTFGDKQEFSPDAKTNKPR